MDGRFVGGGNRRIKRISSVEMTYKSCCLKRKMCVSAKVSIGHVFGVKSQHRIFNLYLFLNKLYT